MNLIIHLQLILDNLRLKILDVLFHESVNVEEEGIHMEIVSLLRYVQILALRISQWRVVPGLVSFIHILCLEIKLGIDIKSMGIHWYESFSRKTLQCLLIVGSQSSLCSGWQLLPLIYLLIDWWTAMIRSSSNSWSLRWHIPLRSWILLILILSWRSLFPSCGHRIALLILRLSQSLGFSV